MHTSVYMIKLPQRTAVILTFRKNAIMNPFFHTAFQNLPVLILVKKVKSLLKGLYKILNGSAIVRTSKVNLWINLACLMYDDTGR